MRRVGKGMLQGVKKQNEEKKGGWEEERKEFMERGRWNIEEIEKIREMRKSLFLKRNHGREKGGYRGKKDGEG